MQYTKIMIDLVFQIRKAAPAPVRPKIKLTNPNLPATLVDIYRVVDEEALKVLIYEFLTHAGGDWVKVLTNPATTEMANTQSARPQAHQQVRTEVPEMPLHAPKKEKVMMYRGRRMVVPA